MAEPIKFRFFSEIELPDNLKNKLSKDETPICCFKTTRDAAVFTNKRILIGDKLGLTESKSEYVTIPYRSILTYTIVTAGIIDFDAEIKLILINGILIELSFIKGNAMPQMLRKAYDALTQFAL